MLETVQQILDDLLKAGELSQEKHRQYSALNCQNFNELLRVLEKDGALTEEALAQAKSKALNLPYINLEGKDISLEVLKLLPQDLAENYQMLIFDKAGNEISVGLINPLNYKAVEAIEFLARKKNYRIKYFIISAASFKYIYREYENIREQVGEALDFAEEKFAPKEEEAVSEKVTKLDEIVKTAPVSKIVSVILRHAIEGGASDIHIEPQGDKSRIRFRIDGILHTSIVLPIYVHAALISRIKVISNLKIDETRLPQDGRIRLNINNKDIDFRVSTLPLYSQEKVVMRILDTSKGVSTWEDLGYEGKNLELMYENILKPHGMFLVTGPTGSGKSTTLYAALNLLNKEEVNIITLEDPVEYYLTG